MLFKTGRSFDVVALIDDAAAGQTGKPIPRVIEDAVREKYQKD